MCMISWLIAAWHGWHGCCASSEKKTIKRSSLPNWWGEGAWVLLVNWQAPKKRCLHQNYYIQHTLQNPGAAHPLKSNPSGILDLAGSGVWQDVSSHFMFLTQTIWTKSALWPLWTSIIDIPITIATQTLELWNLKPMYSFGKWWKWFLFFWGGGRVFFIELYEF